MTSKGPFQPKAFYDSVIHSMILCASECRLDLDAAGLFINRNRLKLTKYCYGLAPQLLCSVLTGS